MADKKSVGHAYNVDFLNVVFAASSLFLFLSVIWMVWDDFDRDWEKPQRSFAQLKTQVTNLSLHTAGRAAARQLPRTLANGDRRGVRREAGRLRGGSGVRRLGGRRTGRTRRRTFGSRLRRGLD